MADLDGFDATEHKDMDTFEAIPAGDYKCMIVESIMKDTKKGDGQYLELVFEVLEGDYQGRKVWERLNLVNPNSTAVEIAQRALAAICKAVGIVRPKDSEELHSIPLVVDVKQEKRKDNGEMTNRPKGYTAVGAAAPTGATGKAKENGAKAGKPPWQR